MKPSNGNVGIWIIEDDPRYRKTLAKLLNETEGMTCEKVFDRCEDAIDMITQGGAPQIVLIDIGLPGMSGIEGIRTMKRTSPSTDFIVLTIRDDHRNVFEAICAGATGYLVKDLTPDEIIEKINEVQCGGAPMNPGIARQVISFLAGNGIRSETYGLTERERKVLSLMTEGFTRSEIADQLFVSPSTILTHARNIYRKLHVHNRGGAVAKALKEHLL